MIAKPFSPGQRVPGRARSRRERITFDKAMIGSCTNGSYDDLLSAALVLRAARGAGPDEGGDASSSSSRARAASKRQIETPDPRLGGESIADVFRVGRRRDPRSRGAARASARAPTRSTPGQRAITSFNRNWQNRMGLGGEGYLASPSVVAASALLGYMAPPSELGLKMGAGALRGLSALHGSRPRTGQ